MSHHQQSLPRSARPDLILEVGLEPPAVNPASRIQREDQQVAVEPASCIPHEDLPPVVLEIPRGSPDLEEEPSRIQNHPSALTCLESGSDLPLGSLRSLGRPHHPPLTAQVSARPPSGGGVSNSSDSRKAAA